MKTEVQKFYEILAYQRIKELSVEFNNSYKELLEESVNSMLDWENPPRELASYHQGLRNDLEKIKKYTFTPLDIYTLTLDDFTQSRYSKKQFFEHLSYSKDDFKSFITVEDNVVEVFELALSKLISTDSNPKFKDDLLLNLPDLKELGFINSKFQKLLKNDEAMEVLFKGDFINFKKYWSLYYLYMGEHKSAFLLLLNKFFSERLNTRVLMMNCSNSQFEIYTVLRDYVYVKYPDIPIDYTVSKIYNQLINRDNIIIYYYSALKSFERYSEDGWLLFFRVLEGFNELLEDRYYNSDDKNFVLEKIYFNADDFLKVYDENMPLEWSLELYFNI